MMCESAADVLVISWDTVSSAKFWDGTIRLIALQFRTFYPLMALHSPETYAQIVDNYIDAYRKRGWMPDCRANNLPGWTQGG